MICQYSQQQFDNKLVTFLPDILFELLIKLVKPAWSIFYFYLLEKVISQYFSYMKMIVPEIQKEIHFM